MEKNKKPKTPNELLRHEREKRGWSQSRVAEFIEADTSMISRWECGERKPEPLYQERLCKLFGKNAAELGFITPPTFTIEDRQKQPFKKEKMDTENRDTTNTEHLLFGNLETTWIVVDGNGIGRYLSRDIHTHFDSHPDELPQDLLEKRHQIEQQQKQNRQRGIPFQWNGERYSLDRFVLSRDGDDENLALDLWFKPSDYYTFLATNMSLDEKALRDKYLQDADWNEPVRFFSNSFGIYLVLLTSDNFTLFTRRGKGLGSRPGEYNISVCEGLDKQDASFYGNAPNVYHCAERGIEEELGLIAPDDFSPSNVTFLSFGVDTQYAQWCLLGMVKVYKTAEEIINYRRAGVRDKFENAQMHFVKFELDTIIPFVFQHQTWAPGAIACLYHTLVHKFGRSRVEEAIKQHLNEAVAQTKAIHSTELRIESNLNKAPDTMPTRESQVTQKRNDT